MAMQTVRMSENLRISESVTIDLCNGEVPVGGWKGVGGHGGAPEGGGRRSSRRLVGSFSVSDRWNQDEMFGCQCCSPI